MPANGSYRNACSSVSVALAIALAATLLIGACSASPKQGRPTTARSETGVATPASRGASNGTTAGAAPVASWRDHALTWDQLHPAMAELAGATVLKDAFLDFRIEQALAERRQSIDASAIQRERALLLASLDPDPNTAERLLDGIRLRQGLGPTRFDALLKRNAGLRALVAADVQVTQSALNRQFEIDHGPKRVCRVMSLKSLHEADRLRHEINAGTPFADLATRHSTDASAARGGLLPPIAQSDPTWPQPFRDALFALSPNQVSIPTLVDNDYLVIQLIEERPADGTSMASVSRAVEDSLRQTQERILMEEKARAFVAEIRPSIYDTALDQAWRRAERQ